MWQCPKCGRKFAKRNQAHSHNVFPLAQHFESREKAKTLYRKLLSEMKKIGPFRVDSVPCCIHFTSTFVFAGVYVLKDKLRGTFSLARRVEELGRGLRLSKNRYLYQVEILDGKRINRKLIGWLREAYNINEIGGGRHG